MDCIFKADHGSFQAGSENINVYPPVPGGSITIPPKTRVTLDRTESTETPPTYPQYGFLSLPYELRCHIYQLLISASDEIYSCNDPTPDQNWTKQHMTQLQTFLLVCRRMNEHEPIKEIFYKHHTFVVDMFNPEQGSQELRRPSANAWDHCGPNQYFLNRLSWLNTMSRMRKMVFRLAPPGRIGRGGSTTSPTREMSNTKVDFEHHVGWRQTLGNVSVLGLHMLNSDEAEKYGFTEWLFRTLWSLVGALPIVPSTQAVINSPTVSYQRGTHPLASAILPPGPIIVVHIEGSIEYGGNGRAQAAKNIVDRVIPKDRFRYVSCPEAMYTPFLDRKRITPAWGAGESQDLDQGLVKDALDAFFGGEEAAGLGRGRIPSSIVAVSCL